MNSHYVIYTRSNVHRYAIVSRDGMYIRNYLILSLPRQPSSGEEKAKMEEEE
jgi:hypothetical protein